MNILSEIRLEIIRDNLTFSCCLPANTTHEVALHVMDEFKAGIEQMQKVAKERAVQAEVEAKEA